MARITLQTIADDVGVSRTTVSNAFSRPDQLSDELRDRIMAAADRLGYRGPDPAARALRRGRAGVLGVILKESLRYAFADPYAVAFLGSLAAEAEDARLAVLLIPCPPGTDQADGVREAVVDAFCLFSLPEGHPVVTAALGRGLPAVLVDGPRAPGHPFIGIDDHRAMAAVVEHVIGLGHRRVAIVAFRLRGDGRSGPVDADRLHGVEYRVTRERLQGALEACRIEGIEPTVFESGPNTRAAGRRAAEHLLDGDDPPTAIVCLSDTLALGVLDAAEGRGVAVPGQLSVTGFDDVPAAAHAGLTTVQQDAAAKGRAAGRLLRSGGSQDVILDHRIALRSTTGPPSAGTPAPDPAAAPAAE